MTYFSYTYTDTTGNTYLVTGGEGSGCVRIDITIQTE